MPQNPSPPYGVNTLPPRQLNRWLDVNSQNGSLKRTRGYVSLPLNSINQVNGPAVGIGFTNNTADFIFFRIIDVSGNVLSIIPVASGSSGGIFNVPSTGYAALYNNTAPPFIFPFIGWSGTITLNADHSWTSVTSISVSQKVLQFNYQSSRNFSVINDSYLKALIALYDTTCLVCITDIIEGDLYNQVVRYALTGSRGERVGAIPYSGQKILGQYFQIEFWSRKNTRLIIAPTTVAMLLYTSQLGDIDYRFGEDFTVSPAAVTVTDFANNNSAVVNTFGLPLTFNDNNISGLN